MHSFNIETPPSGQVVHLWVQTNFQQVSDPAGEQMFDIIRGKWVDGIGYVDEKGYSLEGMVTVLKWMDTEEFNRMYENNRAEREKENELLASARIRKVSFPDSFKNELKACMNDVCLGASNEIRVAVGSLCDAIIKMIDKL